MDGRETQAKIPRSRRVIYIPTYGRVGKQKTLSWFSKEDKARTVLVCRPNERKDLIREHGNEVAEVIVERKPGVSAARQRAVEHCEEDVVVMFDDDLQFCQRVSDWCFHTNNRALKPTQEDVDVAVQWLYDKIDEECPVTCIAPRGGNNTIKERWEIENGRIMRSFAVHKSTLIEHDVRFDEFYYWEDFHVALSLLELGYKNKINVDAVTGGDTNAKGGVVRNIPKMWGQIRKFKRRHETVRIREKEMNCPETKKRIKVPDLTVYWKKAYRSKVK